MSLFNIFQITGQGMSAQQVRLGTVASNLANSDAVSSTKESAYKSRQPIFASVMQNEMGGTKSINTNGLENGAIGVKVLGVVESNKEPAMEYRPQHAMANEDGYIFKSNVNVMEEMANMISASRTYQADVSIATMTKQLMQRTLNLGK